MNFAQIMFSYLKKLSLYLLRRRSKGSYPQQILSKRVFYICLEDSYLDVAKKDCEHFVKLGSVVTTLTGSEFKVKRCKNLTFEKGSFFSELFYSNFVSIKDMSIDLVIIRGKVPPLFRWLLFSYLPAGTPVLLCGERCLYRGPLVVDLDIDSPLSEIFPFLSHSTE